MAFDGQRKGFILGGGLGLAPLVKSKISEGSNSVSFEKSGAGVHLFIGYGWDNKNLILYEGNVAGFESNSSTIAQGIDAISWYHYFGPMGKSFFSTVGAGLYSYDEDGPFEFESKAGVLLGGGYEFNKHWQVGQYISAGKTESRGVDTDHTTVSVLVSGVAF